MREILARGAPYSESSFYACLINGYEQGLSLKQIQADCETKLGVDDKKGFGPTGRDIAGPFAQNDAWFDPASVKGSCNSGDPRLANGPDGRGNIIRNSTDLGTLRFGKYSWGGKNSCDSDGCYKGLSEAESEQRKMDAIKEAEAALRAFNEADEELKADPNNPALKAAAKAAKEAAEKAYKKAQKDPNMLDPAVDVMPPRDVASTDPPKGPGAAGQPVDPGSTPCDQAVQAAREVLRECTRTGWRSASCQRLQAKMNHCPDPTIILVDPDSGYECGAKIDPEAVKQAWVDRCRRLERPTPGGPDPCEPPKVDALGRYIGGNALDDMCNSLVALIDPESPACLAQIEIRPFGQPDIQELLVIALNKIGGPMVVLPNRNPPPPGPPGPRPGPVPN